MTVHSFLVLAARPGADGDTPVLDVDVEVVCSSGTYVRALARDLGASLGSAGHLLSLRRTRVGPYGIERAHTLDALDEQFSVLPIADAARAAFATRATCSSADAGEISVPKKLTVGYFRQDVEESSGRSVLDEPSQSRRAPSARARTGAARTLVPIDASEHPVALQVVEQFVVLAVLVGELGHVPGRFEPDAGRWPDLG